MITWTVKEFSARCANMLSVRGKRRDREFSHLIKTMSLLTFETLRYLPKGLDSATVTFRPEGKL